uniref:Uncharacterized protein n=1 Tax=Anguilla anguilla TaxID=7936 RepID=A0A0E9UKJ1_ANGAN
MHPKFHNILAGSLPRQRYYCSTGRQLSLLVNSLQECPHLQTPLVELTYIFTPILLCVSRDSGCCGEGEYFDKVL